MEPVEVPRPTHWPVFADVASSFASGPFSRPHKLFSEFAVKQAGSGRPGGPRDLLWQTVVVASVAALEAGLEDLLLGAHAARNRCEGAAVQPGINAPDGNLGKWLVEDRLMAPTPDKLARILFGDFGIMLGHLPAEARFEARRKQISNQGSGKGDAVAGPTTWTELRDYVETIGYIRNAAAHGDAAKLKSPPTKRAGLLWVRKADGVWSVQQPHALTAIRTVLATFNLAAVHLAVATHQPGPRLMLPNDVGYPVMRP